MAWRAELLRRKWYCIVEIDMIQLYKKHLYDEWYNSLTDEQKERYEEQRIKEQEKAEYEARRAMMKLLMISSILRDKVDESMLDWLYNK